MPKFLGRKTFTDQHLLILGSRAVDVNPDEKARVNKMKRRINTCPKCGKEFDILVQYCKHLQVQLIPERTIFLTHK